MLKRNNNNRHQKFSRPQHQHRPNGGKSLASQRNHLQQNFEKYLNLARDAAGIGDKIVAESYYQYAEHYLRTLNDVKAEEERIQAQQQEHRQNHRPQHEKEMSEEVPQSPHNHAEQQDLSNPQKQDQSPQEPLEFLGQGVLNEGGTEGVETPSQGQKRPRMRRPRPQKEVSPTE